MIFLFMRKKKEEMLILLILHFVCLELIEL